MKGESPGLRIDISDDEFDAIYPRSVRKIANKHFTPLAVARTAAEFLVTSDRTKILDVGSGGGKFCIAGSIHTNGHFTGIEQRLSLVELSNKLVRSYDVDHVTFIHANVMAIDFRDFDAFYLYNSFYENVDVHEKIDGTVLVSQTLYRSYSNYTAHQLSATRVGTRLATYYTARAFVPSAFALIRSEHNGRLDLWEKMS